MSISEIAAAKLLGKIDVEIGVGTYTRATDTFHPIRTHRVSATVIYKNNGWRAQVAQALRPKIDESDLRRETYCAIKMFGHWQYPGYAYPYYYLLLEPNHDPTKFPYSPNER